MQAEPYPAWSFAAWTWAAPQQHPGQKDVLRVFLQRASCAVCPGFWMNQPLQSRTLLKQFFLPTVEAAKTAAAAGDSFSKI